jgi:ABC-type sugar transport system ATPase subunit
VSIVQKLALEMKNITKKFPGVTALDNVSLDLNQGEILAVCGENGAGKSTLMKILSGSYPGSSYDGEIRIDGRKVVFNNVRNAEKSGIQMIYQEISLLLDLTVAENIYLGNWPVNKLGLVDYKKMVDGAAEALKVIGLKIDPTVTVRNLGTSTQQLLSILKAYLKNPKILILDEPTSALTDHEINTLFTLIGNMKKKNISCIYISHKLEEVFRIADRISVLRDGKHISTCSKQDVSEQKLVEDMVGRKIENLFPKHQVDIGAEVLKVEKLCVPHPYIARKFVVQDVGFSVRKGEILGVAGLIGSGRTEALNGLFKVIQENVTGKVYMHGKEVVIKKPKDAIKNGIGLITEDRKKSGYVGTMDVGENITLASLKQISGLLIDNNKEKVLSETYKNKLSIKVPSLNSNILTLSGGNQQKVIVAKWLMANLEVLLFDEPTRGIDVGAKAEIYQLMNELVRQGMAIVMVSSEMPELLAMSDRIVVFANGRVAGEFKREEFDQLNIMRVAMNM